MEVWLDGRKSIEAFASLDSGIDRILFPQYSDSTRDYFIDGNRLMNREHLIGSLVTLYDWFLEIKRFKVRSRMAGSG